MANRTLCMWVLKKRSHLTGNLPRSRWCSSRDKGGSRWAFIYPMLRDF